MNTGSICSRIVDLIEPGAPVHLAAQRMRHRNVATLVVQNRAGEPVGILTDRDLAIRVLACGLNSFETRVGEVMTRNPRTVCEDLSIESALAIMKSESCRRLPVVNRAGVLVGVISLDDIYELHAHENSMMRRILKRESPSQAKVASSSIES